MNIEMIFETILCLKDKKLICTIYKRLKFKWIEIRWRLKFEWIEIR